MKYAGVSLSCPGSWTAQRGSRISAVTRSETRSNRSIFEIKALLPKLI